MVGNYAAVIMAWRLLCEFAGLDRSQGDFIGDAITAMNEHIAETSGDREPWVWITDILLNEIDRNSYLYPYVYEEMDDMAIEAHETPVLLIRTSHVMAHIAHTPSLRDRWNGLPIKSDRIFKQHLADAGAVLTIPWFLRRNPTEARREMKIEMTIKEVLTELERATTKFPTWPTDPLHALAILGEEYGELNKAMLQLTYEPHKDGASVDHVREEAIQTAAMALRLAMSLDRYEYAPGVQHSQ